jgi:hypothetical protein
MSWAVLASLGMIERSEAVINEAPECGRSRVYNMTSRMECGKPGTHI